MVLRSLNSCLEGVGGGDGGFHLKSIPDRLQLKWIPSCKTKQREKIITKEVIGKIQTTVFYFSFDLRCSKLKVNYLWLYTGYVWESK